MNVPERRVMSSFRMRGSDIVRRPPARYRVPAVLLALLISACAGENQPDDATTPAPSPPSDTSVAPSDDAAADTVAPAGAEWTAADTRVERQTTGAALLTEVRTARHEGFDRIVIQLDGAVPGYRVSYIDSPVRQCGSGDEVPMGGQGWLSIVLEPANAHTEQGQPTIEERSRTPGLPSVRELRMICDFEAQVEWVAAVTSPEQYRVFELREPARLVIDVRHP